MNCADLRAAFDSTRYAADIRHCIQCGTCSASCLLAEEMEHAPRELFALIRDGDMVAALQSNTPWFCVACYQCATRCPQQIRVTDLMYTLKQMALKYGFAPRGHKMPHFYDAFQDQIRQRGRVTGSLLMARHGVRHPLQMFSKMPLAMGLLRRGRLELAPQSVQEVRNIQIHLSTNKPTKEPS